MAKKRNILDLSEEELNPNCPIGIMIERYVASGTRINEPLVRNEEGEYSASTVTFSMLISESIYKLVVAVERSIHWSRKILAYELF